MEAVGCLCKKKKKGKKRKKKTTATTKPTWVVYSQSAQHPSPFSSVCTKETLICTRTCQLAHSVCSQALQKYRGMDYNTANCNIQELRQPLEPFSRDTNTISLTHDHARAIDAFNYDQFGYQYDSLNFHGLTIPELEKLLEEKKREDHVYANFMLKVRGAVRELKWGLRLVKCHNTLLFGAVVCF